MDLGRQIVELYQAKKEIEPMNGWLVVTGCHGFGIFPEILGISSSQLTNSNLFQRGGVQTIHQTAMGASKKSIGPRSGAAEAIFVAIVFFVTKLVRV